MPTVYTKNNSTEHYNNTGKLAWAGYVQTNVTKCVEREGGLELERELHSTTTQSRLDLERAENWSTFLARNGLAAWDCVGCV